MKMLELRNITKRYLLKGEITHALSDISFDIFQGEFVAIIGPSGSGKSTLLNIMASIDAPSEGVIIFKGKQISGDKKAILNFRKYCIGILFQRYNLIADATIKHNLLLPQFIAGNKKMDALFDISLMLDDLNLTLDLDQYANTLSSGEQQRLSLIRSLVNSPKILFADEPTGSLDGENGERLLSLLLKVNKEKGKTIVIVTHNPEIAKHADRIIHLHDGKIEQIEKVSDRSFDNEDEENVEELLSKNVPMRASNKVRVAFENIRRELKRYSILGISLSIGFSILVSLIILISVYRSNVLNSVTPVAHYNTLIVQAKQINAKQYYLTNSAIDAVHSSKINKLYPVKALYGNILLGETSTPLYATTASPVIEKNSTDESTQLGRYFLNDNENSIILTKDTASLLGYDDPASIINKKITINAMLQQNFPASMEKLIPSLTVVGILDSTSKFQHNLVPYNFYRKHFQAPYVYDTMYLYIENDKNMQAVMAKLDSLNLSYANLGKQELGLDNGTTVNQGIISGFGILSVITLVCCITMILIRMFYSRINEIGIMRSLGSSQNDIVHILLLEGAFLGGVIALCSNILSFMFVQIINYAINNPVIEKVTLKTAVPLPYGTNEILIVTFLSFLIGIGMMVYPIRKISKVKIVNALNRI